MFIDSNVILYKQSNNLLWDLKYVVLKSWKLLLMVLIIGVISGIFIYISDPHRVDASSAYLVKNKSLFLNRAILTGVSSVLGEMGFLSENSSLSIVSIIVIIIIMLSSATIILYYQAVITNLLFQKKNDDIKMDDIKDKTLLAYKHYRPTHIILVHNPKKIYYIKGNLDKVVDEYLDENKRHADGIIMSYVDSIKYLKEYKNVRTSSFIGHELASFIVSKNKMRFKMDINKILFQPKIRMKLYNICKQHHGKEYGNKLMCNMT